MLPVWSPLQREIVDPALSVLIVFGILHRAMRQIVHFVPGDRGGDAGVLSHWRWPVPARVARAYVEAYADPGEVVLVPYCQGSAIVRESVASGRQVLALNFDPLLILVLEAELTPLPAQELDGAVARLGDSLKQGVPLRRYLAGLYTTTCPACLRPAIAEYFVWDREQGVPVAKHLRCPACGWDGRAAVDMEDRERLGEIPTKGMHYHYVLDRLAPQEQADAIRPRLEQLLELYSSRNLYSLAELTLKIESLFSAEPIQRALKVLLLDCLDRCSSLTPLPGSRARRRGLGRPGRFLERNVWYSFEEAVTRLRIVTCSPLEGLAGDLGELRISGGERKGFVGQGLVRDLPRVLSPRSVRLVLTSPPPLDSAVWSLSYLWSAWLLGAEAAAPLRPLLRQRTPDLAWYARVMTGSLRTLAELLRDDGRLALVLTEQRPTVAEALMLAASSARLGVASLVQCGADYRLELVPTYPAPVTASGEALSVQIQQRVVQVATETIQVRGEPTTWRTLHAAIYRSLAETGLLARAQEVDDEGLHPLDFVAEQVRVGLEDPAFVCFPDGYSGQEAWWLDRPSEMSEPLCNRVEEVTTEVLHDALTLTEVEFAQAVYARLPGSLTPDADLVAVCLRAYGREPTPGCWQLRTEDLPAERLTERQTIIEHLLDLGRRLGYRTKSWPPFDAAWVEGVRVHAVFVVRWQAAVGEALALSDQAAGASPYLVIPGGRAALVSFKLAHNPLWRQTVDKADWRFIKYRHVRQLVAQPEVDVYALRTIVGLDPIVEREQAQLPLF